MKKVVVKRWLVAVLCVGLTFTSACGNKAGEKTASEKNEVELAEQISDGKADSVNGAEPADKKADSKNGDKISDGKTDSESGSGMSDGKTDNGSANGKEDAGNGSGKSDEKADAPKGNGTTGDKGEAGNQNGTSDGAAAKKSDSEGGTKTNDGKIDNGNNNGETGEKQDMGNENTTSDGQTDSGNGTLDGTNGDGQGDENGKDTTGEKSDSGNGVSDGKKKADSAGVTDLMKGIRANNVSVKQGKNQPATVAATDFSVRMFQGTLSAGENTLVSPASVLFALGMTANGARGNTLAQFEKAFGMPMEELNSYLYAYRQSLPNEENCKVQTANSIWFKQDPRLSVSKDFLQMNADYYAAGIYEAPFDDSTRNDINKWVKKNTNDMIKEIVDRIPEDTFMYLVNAMAFDAKWQQPYESYEVYEETFTKEDGKTQEVDFMHSKEDKFLEDEHATGFIKYYEGGKYAFAALLPEEGMKLESYVASLTGERLNRILNNPTDIEVRASMPKFKAEYSAELGAVLGGMGITDAFDTGRADFTGLATCKDENNICINRVLHKTYICVDENGTKAAAVTAVEMMVGCAPMEEIKYKVVRLDRPYIYFLIDCEEGLPIFMGTVYTVK